MTSTKAAAVRILGAALRTLVAAGLLLMLGGAGLFVYVIFIRPPEIDEGGVLVASTRLAEDERTAVLETPPFAEDTRLQPRFDFIVHTDWYVETTTRYSYGPVTTRAPAFRQWVKLTFTDEAGGVAEERTAAMAWDTAFEPEDAGTPDDAPYEGEPMSNVPRHYRLRPPVLVPAGSRMTMRAELVDLPGGDLDDPIDDRATNLGRIADVELSLHRDVADVVAYTDFNAEAPTWGLYGGLAGLALTILGGVGLARLPAPAERPPLLG